MFIHVSSAWSVARRISLKDRGIEVGHAYVLIMKDDAHARPLATIENVFIDSERRGEGLGEMLIDGARKVANQFDCYKIVLTSRDGRDRLHAWYEKLGFAKHGSSFRKNL